MLSPRSRLAIEPPSLDIVASGAILSVGCGFLALASFISLGLLWFRPNRKTRTQALTLGFFTVWVLATGAATLALALNGSVNVSARIGKTKVPEALVAAAEKAAGVSRVYWEHDYCKSSRWFLSRTGHVWF